MNIFPALLLQAVPRDTIVTVMARDGLATAVDIATVALALALLVGVLAVVALILALRRGVIQLKELASRLEKDPILRRTQNVVENVESITSSLRQDVARLSSSVDHLSGRLDQAADRMEERIEDFNALLEVVQEEAEDVFVRTASRVRGVRAAADSLTGGGPEVSSPRQQVEPGPQPRARMPAPGPVSGIQGPETSGGAISSSHDADPPHPTGGRATP
jgi:hypothetical protein